MKTDSSLLEHRMKAVTESMDTLQALLDTADESAHMRIVREEFAVLRAAHAHEQATARDALEYVTEVLHGTLGENSKPR